MFHHYSGNVTQAKAVEEHGWLLSFSTVHVRNPNKSLIKAVSLESMVAETDSPFLDPSGKRNEPMNVKGVVDSIATVKGLPFDKIDSVIDDNARAFFGIR